MPEILSKISLIQSQFQQELKHILDFWSKNMVDWENGGFLGEIDFNNQKNFQAEKGAVLNARILYAFSAAYNFKENPAYLALAERAFIYIYTHFIDKKVGGVYWTVDFEGNPKQTKKQIYAQAFMIYGLAEYYQASKNEYAKDLAVDLFKLIEKHSFDKGRNGYFEAFDREWKKLEDLRLSEKDKNESKTMNTHLHIVEAYANLYRVWKNDFLKERIQNLLYLIDEKFINKKTWRLKLFFDDDWNESPDVISYGHDVEAAWLLLWCAEQIQDEYLIQIYQHNAEYMNETVLDGLDEDGALWYEKEIQSGELIAEKHWWPQNEFWLGMFTLWELTEDERYLDLILKNLEFCQQHLIDRKNGGWFWGIDADGNKIQKEKAGMWKCPYHNVRACLEILNRIKISNKIG